jgi:NitT/TauT family transport system substrate-binding protein
MVSGIASRRYARVGKFIRIWATYTGNALPWVGSVVGLLLYFDVWGWAAFIKQQGAAGALLAFASIAGVCAIVAAHSVWRTTSVTVAQFSKLMPYLPLYIADEYGFFRQEGIRVSFKDAHGDRKTWQSVFARDAEFGVADPIAMLDENAGAGKLIGQIVSRAAVWGLTKHPTLALSDLGRPDVNVYVWDQHSTSNKLFRSYLRQQLPEHAETIIRKIREIDVGTELGALVADKDSIVLMCEPSASKARALGAREIFSAPEYYGEYLFTGIFARSDYLERHRDIACRFMFAIERAIEVMHRNKGESIDFAIQEFSGDDATALRSMARMFLDQTFSKTTAIDQTGWTTALQVRFGSSERHPFREHVDDSIAAEVRRRLDAKNRRSQRRFAVLRKAEWPAKTLQLLKNPEIS